MRDLQSTRLLQINSEMEIHMLLFYFLDGFFWIQILFFRFLQKFNFHIKSRDIVWVGRFRGGDWEYENENNYAICFIFSSICFKGLTRLTGASSDLVVSFVGLF